MIEKAPTKTTLKRAKQRDALVAAARRAIAHDGLNALKARDLAQEIGVALGSIYNLVSDLDELILLVSAQTLEELDATIGHMVEQKNPKTPEQELILIGTAYHHFARANYHLWRTLFDHRPPEERLPDWVPTVRMRPFRRVEKPLTVLMKKSSEQDIALFAQTLFSAVHGMVSIGLDSHDVGVRKEQLDDQIAFLLSTICKGL